MGVRKQMTERRAIIQMMEAWTRLRELGWKEIMYAPRDRTTFEVIEPGSTGIHPCQHWEEPTRGSFWVLEPGDALPSHPILWRPKQ